MAPLSFAQQRLWFVQQLDPESPVYNVPSALRIQGDLNLAGLTRSISLIVERHEILRTTYQVFNDAPFQRINPSSQLDLPISDLSNISRGHQESELLFRLEEESRIPFNLSKDPVLRAKLFRLAPQEHVLFVNIHHIACDGWSMELFFRELWQFYAAFSQSKTDLPQELPIQYADFADWQRTCLTEAALAEDRKFWSKHLEGCQPRVDIIRDFVPGDLTANTGDRKSRIISLQSSDAIRDLARLHSATPFVVFLSAFNLLLYRYTGQEDLALGTPISGRSRFETEKLIGFFVNLLVLRSNMSGDPTFAELLSRLRDASVAAFSHQQLPFEQLVESVHSHRGSAQNPFFNVVFAVQNQMDLPRVPGLSLSSIEVHNHTAKFDLNLTILDTKKEFELTIEYRSDLFASETISRLLGHLELLLVNSVADPSKTLSEISFLSPAEERSLLFDWNQTDTPFPRSQCVHELFEHQAALRPDAPAVMYGQDRISYGELNVRANQLAHFLARHGVGPEKLVGVCLDRSVVMIVAMLGILKAGGAYLPLDQSYPVERLAFMLDDAGVSVVLTDSAGTRLLPQNKAKTIILDQERDRLLTEDASNPPNLVGSENSIYVIYTSGSTGTPKGICIPHRGVTRLLCDTNYIRLDKKDKIAQLSNASFDAATFEIWGALLFGGQLIGIPKDIAISPSDLVKTLREQNITTAFLTTALFNQVAAVFPAAFSSLNNLLFGGEAVDPNSVRAVLKHGAPQRLLHVYGPTETTTFASWYQIRNLPDNASTVPIGKPVSNTEFYVLDHHRRVVPVGVPGELYIGGDGVALGYLKRESLTRERFIENPFNPASGKRLYRTGDLVRYTDDGNLEFISRIDNQVKLRGFRIELGEIEAALLTHGSVGECAVVVREDSPGNKRLVGYVVPASNTTLSVAELRKLLKGKLPEYMVPGLFVFLDRLPLNHNGKIDRRALPAPGKGEVEPGGDRVLARNNLELELTKIWQQVLDVQPIGVKESFFDLGGHSLLAVRLFSQINRVFGRDLPLTTLFTSPTIEDLANLLGTNGPAPQGSCVVQVQPKGSRPPIFWLHTLGGGGGAGLFTYRKLSERMDPDQPSFGFVAPAQPHTSIEEMAAHYISELRIYQPRGPYYLGGYCFGGVVAFEMALQLVNMGEEVRMVALVDSTPPGVGFSSTFLRPRYARDIATFWKDTFLNSAKLSPTRLLKVAGRKLTKIKARLLSSAPRTAGLEDHIDLSAYPPDFLKTAQTHWQALLKYKPSYYSGTVTLFRARNRPPVTLDPTLGWSSCAKEVEIKVLPGAHETILNEPHVDSLAQALTAVLRLHQDILPIPDYVNPVGSMAASKVA